MQAFVTKGEKPSKRKSKGDVDSDRFATPPKPGQRATKAKTEPAAVNNVSFEEVDEQLNNEAPSDIEPASSSDEYKPDEEIEASVQAFAANEAATALVTREHALSAMPKSPGHPSALVASLTNNPALIRASELPPLVFKPSQQLRAWFSTKNHRRMNHYEVPLNYITMVEEKYEGKRFESMVAKYPNWKKTRDVKLKTYEPFNKVQGERIFTAQIVGPYQLAMFTKMGPTGNAYDMGQYDPKGEKLHAAQRSLVLTDKAFCPEVDDGHGNNIDAKSWFDWLESFDQHMFNIQIVDPNICKDIKKSVKEVKMPEAERISIRMKQPYDAATQYQISMMAMWRGLVSKYVDPKTGKETRQLKLGENVFRFRDSKEKAQFYQAPIPKLQEMINIMSDDKYQYYEKGKYAHMMVNDVPVYVPKTNEENRRDFARGIKFPWRRLSFEESCLMNSGAVVAPWIEFSPDEGTSSRAAGISKTIIGLFWARDAGAAGVYADNMEEPFLLDDEEDDAPTSFKTETKQETKAEAA